MMRALRILLAVLMLPLPANLARAAEPGAPDAATAMAQARELVRNGDNDRAIEVLRATIAGNAGRPDVLKDAYLLLIKTYVFLGNDYKFRPQGREASNLNYRAARELIEEALAVPALRRLEPVPAEDYPPEMVQFFAEARSRMFGAYRIVGLEPANATVVFDGAVLAPDSNARERSVADLPVGPHTVAVSAPGYKSQTETLTISPSATLERTYRLDKKRSPWWYVGGAALIGGTVAIVAGQNTGSTGGPEPLPGAPPPPGN